MKKRLNKFFSLLLTVAMVIGMMPMLVFAVEHVHDYTHSYTYIDGSKQHYGVCSCSEVSTTPADCVYSDDVPAWDMSPSETREGKRTWKCTLCEGKWEETVPAHECTHNNMWEPDEDDNFYHCTYCTYPGCGGWMGEEHTGFMTGWVHEDATTLKDSCTRCGYFRTTTVESSFVTVEAKSATCITAGNNKCYICEHCGKYFADETCQKQYTPAEVFINPTPHNYVDGVCTECGAKVTSARFMQTPDEYFGSDDEYLYVFVGMGNDGMLYAMGEATGDGRRYGVEIPGAQIDENGVITLTPDQAEFMLYEYYFENGSGASTTSTFTVDGGYMTVKNGKIYVFPKSHLDDPENPRPIDFNQADYGDDSGLGNVDADDYDPKTNTHTHEYMTFNPDTLCFEACATKQNTIYLYRQICDHEESDVVHYTYVPATCTEQGTREYWYCSKCLMYFSNAACTQKYEFPDYIDPNDSVSVAKYFQINALGHKFAENGVCEHCSMKRNVYRPVTTLEQFDQLRGDAYYIIVFKDGDNTYAARLPELEYPCDTDSDGDGIVDVMEADANANDIPDCIEDYIKENWGYADEDENGVITVEEYNEAIGDMTDDGFVNEEDYKLFFQYNVYWNLFDHYDELAYSADNFVEVKVDTGGSITIVDEGAMEFQMMESAVWGGAPFDKDELLSEAATLGVDLETERIRAAWVPNYWFACDGGMGEYGESHFMTQRRWYGDYNKPGIVDNKNWKISFNTDGTVHLVSSWTTFEDTGALQLVKYTNKNGEKDMTIVGLPQDQWKDSDIMINQTALLPAYLYASEPVYDVPSHTCDFGDWVDDENGDTHTRTCKDPECGKTETKPHGWDNGVQVGTPTCTEGAKTVYTCGDCGATYEDDIDNLGHDWGDWTDDGENSPTDTHSCTCKRDCGVAAETENHSWSRWTPVDDNTHTKTCSDCNGTRTATHNWNDGVITTQPTEDAAGVKTYTCSSCGATKTEPVDKLVHEHSWSDWSPNNDGTHTRSCRCNASETGDCTYGSGVITEQPTHTEKGVKTYTCTVCGHTYTEDVPVLTDHAWGEWVINKLDEANTHIRYCICDESQTAPHNFDEGVVTTEATHTSKGIKTYTCGDCRYSYTEEIPETTEHQWTDWSDNKDGTHTRSCRCNATETESHTWGEGVVTAPTCTEAGKTTYTCGDCGAIKTEPGEAALNHDWTDWTDTGANATADVHKRSCKRGCGIADEIGNHDWSSWTSTGSTEHKKTCSVCSGERTAAHAWDDGEEIKPATTTTTGTKKYTCSGCGATKTEVIPKVGCDHTWGKWEAENDETHKHTCVNGKGCEAFQQQAHDWDNGVVTTEPTETTEGVKTYTCLTCSYEKTEAIAMLKHTHSFGRWTSDGADTHTRRCENGNTCTAAETEAHSCDSWSNNGTNHTGRCSVCYDAMSEAHTWGDWEVQDGGILKRTCTACDAFEEMAVRKPIDETVGNTTDSSDNAAKAELVLESPVELFNSVLTNEEQSAVAGGNTTVSVYLEVEDITDSAPTADVAAAADAAAAQNDNSKIGMYLDINLFKEVTTTDSNTSQTETEASQITETNNEVTITITVPDELINTDPNVTRTYKIVRVHDGWAEIIYGDFDPATKTLTFKTSKFSTYALAYADASTPVYDPYIPAPATYPVSTAPATNGAVKVNYTNVVAGATVTITVEPKTGYTLETLTVLDQLGRQIPVTNVGGGKYTFRMPAGGVTVVPTFMEDNTMLNFFVDVKAGDYYYDAVLWAAVNGITKGDTAVTFAPDKACTRAQMVTFLWRAAGCPEPTGTAKGFADVTADSYYSKAVLWAVEQGITNGTGDTTFSPDATCTRAQMATFLCRLAGGKAVGTAAGFTDVKSDAYYAEAVRWAAENGITNGTGDGTTFSPDATCTRGQMVTFLYRYFAN